MCRTIPHYSYWACRQIFLSLDRGRLAVYAKLSGWWQQFYIYRTNTRVVSTLLSNCQQESKLASIHKKGLTFKIKHKKCAVFLKWRHFADWIACHYVPAQRKGRTAHFKKKDSKSFTSWEILCQSHKSSVWQQHISSDYPLHPPLCLAVRRQTHTERNESMLMK